MAFFAGHGGVFAFESVARQFVVEVFLRFFPVNQGKAFAVVLEVTTNTIFATRILHPEPRVIAAILREEFCNFLVAIKTTECRSFGAKFVAACTLRCSTKRLVRFGEGTGRNLSGRGRSTEDEQ